MRSSVRWSDLARKGWEGCQIFLKEKEYGGKNMSEMRDDRKTAERKQRTRREQRQPNLLLQWVCGKYRLYLSLKRSGRPSDRQDAHSRNPDRLSKTSDQGCIKKAGIIVIACSRI
jgi:hypothetical protein